ncbi:MAG: UDP-N-acetylglucosamine--N-acetylmuramyl-(pentapeptide) pyrophosphoryl-undecaprenol N-acetylglucosamine transferase [Planctomycetes bacterium]|nr:UDP-N-acetylglucosamine--N-acetylmuramyl-(pentapeptide) pyrophosphoryl-undecaprenol N-acetylglucosamine transferase [Planctomycetota bacterium]
MPKAAGVLFCGGGTGGHVLPGLAVAAALRARGEGDLRWVGDPERIEARLVPGAGIPLLPFGLSRPRPRDPRWLLASARQAFATWRELVLRPPRVVVALGGYAALLPGIIAPLTGRPLVVMEQNARAGRTNRLLARLARAVVTQFDEAALWLPRRRTVRLGNPVRAISPRPRGRGERLNVLVVGGSLAAKSLNDLVLGAAAEVARIPGLHLIHLAGEQDAGRVEGVYRSYGIDAEVHGFCDDMPALYRRVDLALTRAGATTVAELCAAGIGALYVPLPWAADDHQTANAGSVAAVGGAVLLPQASTSAAMVASWLARLAADRDQVARMGLAAAALARPQAARHVAALVMRSARQARRLRRLGRRADARARWRDLVLARTGLSAQAPSACGGSPAGAGRRAAPDGAFWGASAPQERACGAAPPQASAAAEPTASPCDPLGGSGAKGAGSADPMRGQSPTGPSNLQEPSP